MLELLLNDISSADFGIALRERPIIPSPERDVEQVPVRGRHGSLTRKYGYNNINIPVRLNVLSREIKPDIRYIKAWLMKANRLQISDDNVYYIVDNVSVSDIENTFRKIGVFEVVFNCKPFQYEDVTYQPITVKGEVIHNPGTVESQPYIKVTGTGAVTLDINGRDFLMTLTDYIEIDSELGYTYRGTAGMDDKVNGNLPILDVGNNTISWTGSVTKIEIKTKAVYL